MSGTAIFDLVIQIESPPSVASGLERVGPAARHRIYFEVRAKVGAGGLPIDPEPLLAPRD